MIAFTNFPLLREIERSTGSSLLFFRCKKRLPLASPPQPQLLLMTQYTMRPRVLFLKRVRTRRSIKAQDWLALSVCSPLFLRFWPPRRRLWFPVPDRLNSNGHPFPSASHSPMRLPTMFLASAATATAKVSALVTCSRSSSNGRLSVAILSKSSPRQQITANETENDSINNKLIPKCKNKILYFQSFTKIPSSDHILNCLLCLHLQSRSHPQHSFWGICTTPSQATPLCTKQQ